MTNYFLQDKQQRYQYLQKILKKTGQKWVYLDKLKGQLEVLWGMKTATLNTYFDALQRAEMVEIDKNDDGIDMIRLKQ